MHAFKPAFTGVRGVRRETQFMAATEVLKSSPTVRRLRLYEACPQPLHYETACHIAAALWLL